MHTFWSIETAACVASVPHEAGSSAKCFRFLTARKLSWRRRASRSRRTLPAALRGNASRAAIEMASPLDVLFVYVLFCLFFVLFSFLFGLFVVVVVFLFLFLLGGGGGGTQRQRLALSRSVTIFFSSERCNMDVSVSNRSHIHNSYLEIYWRERLDLRRIVLGVRNRKAHE